MDTRKHANKRRNTYYSGIQADWAKRKPLLLLRFADEFLLRLDERKFAGLLFQEPPRKTRFRIGYSPSV